MGQEPCTGQDYKCVVCATLLTDSFLVPINMDYWQPLKSIMYVKREHISYVEF
jgi:hypothetical protein